MPTPLEAQVDKLIADFDDWFQKETGNEPMVRSERAIIKTMLWWLVHKCGVTTLPGVVVPVKESTNGEEAGVRDEVQPV